MSLTDLATVRRLHLNRGLALVINGRFSYRGYWQVVNE